MFYLALQTVLIIALEIIYSLLPANKYHNGYDFKIMYEREELKAV